MIPLLTSSQASAPFHHTCLQVFEDMQKCDVDGDWFTLRSILTTRNSSLSVIKDFAGDLLPGLCSSFLRPDKIAHEVRDALRYPVELLNTCTARTLHQIAALNSRKVFSSCLRTAWTGGHALSGTHATYFSTSLLAFCTFDLTPVLTKVTFCVFGVCRAVPATNTFLCPASKGYSSWLGAPSPSPVTSLKDSPSLVD